MENRRSREPHCEYRRQGRRDHRPRPRHRAPPDHARSQLVRGARQQAEIAAVTREIEAAGGHAVHLVTDVTRQSDLQALVDLACHHFGRLDVMVNNAGIGPLSRSDAIQVADWDAMIDVNLKGVLYGIAASLPVFQRQQSGHVFNIVSTAGLKILPTMGVYAASKNALRTATEALRQEAGPHLRVTEVSPGFVDTEFASSTDDPGIRAAIEQRKAPDCDCTRGDRPGCRVRDRAAAQRRNREHRRPADGARLTCAAGHVTSDLASTFGASAALSSFDAAAVPCVAADTNLISKSPGPFSSSVD